ncbi:hypothetical protein QJ856_gp0792 [Tupanvirus deep ocean]|uniref:Uncharacterized protein n=2 Tax=Tupanvirus TaxID=2094720 RepID=A0AC62A860_9VIRU|nr:hypothetical protein QJ856_gp0792 [Tupanvirus deep ocean]QKU33961.1 hypothetical protein [Tupanvirus deep ocean]
MTSTINLHSIFCHLAGDENFLSTIIETDAKDIEQKKNKQKGFNLMASMVTEYVPLIPYESQNYSLFPHKVKSFLTPDYVRMGVKNTTERNMTVVNISFLNSLNMLMRPDLYKMTFDDHIKNFNLLESYVCHTIHRNYQIDKVKNTKKVQAANKLLIKNLTEGKISHELIQYIVNIFEINLLVFDLTKMEILLYWTKGNKYPYFNPFKNIYCMAYVQGNYEPIMTNNNFITDDQKKKIYLQILTNIEEIKCMPEIKLAIHTLFYISSWDIDTESFNKIVDTYFKKPPCIDINSAFEALENLEKY